MGKEGNDRRWLKISVGGGEGGACAAAGLRHQGSFLPRSTREAGSGAPSSASRRA
jgi:hypothetical protein